MARARRGHRSASSTDAGGVEVYVALSGGHVFAGRTAARGYRVHVSNPAGEDPATSFRRAERRLRDVLLGDGTYSAGTVKGEEARAKVAIDIRHMREAFETLLAAADAARAERAEARVADLEQELRRLAAAGSRRRPTKKKV